MIGTAFVLSCLFLTILLLLLLASETHGALNVWEGHFRMWQAEQRFVGSSC